MYHVTVEQLRLIEWARSFNWAVRFPDYRTPGDFKDWFPATDVSYNFFWIDKQEFPAGNGTMDFPKSTSISSLNLSLVDGSRRRGPSTTVLQLHDWIKAWGDDMVDLSTGVLTLSEACRPIEIIHYNSLSNLIGRIIYAVYPHGEINFTGGSDSEISKLEITFSIAGTVESNTGN